MLAGRGFGISRNVTFQTNHTQKNPAFNVLSPLGQNGGVRHGSKLREIQARRKSVKSIEKITKTMKMIASSRLKASQVRMEKSRPFWQGATKVLEVLPAKMGEKNLIIPVAADRGLCGAINSNIIKGARAMVNAREKEYPNSQFRLVTVGDKSIQGLGRDQSSRVAFHIGDLSRKPFSFAGASVIAEKVMAEEKFDSITVLNNKFISPIAYGQENTKIQSPQPKLI